VVDTGSFERFVQVIRAPRGNSNVPAELFFEFLFTLGRDPLGDRLARDLRRRPTLSLRCRAKRFVKLRRQRDMKIFRRGICHGNILP
jgi:hypothetical protein